jgi:hypothetical protein
LLDSLDYLQARFTMVQKYSEFMQQLVGRSLEVLEDIAEAGTDDSFANLRMFSHLTELISHVEPSADNIVFGDTGEFEKVITDFIRLIKKAERRIKVKPEKWEGPNPIPSSEEYLFEEEFL